MRRMPFTSRWWLLLLLATACSLKLVAQEVKPPSTSDFLDPQQGITEDELVTRALASNPMLGEKRQRSEMAKGDVIQARPHKNPSLMFGGLREVNGNDHGINVPGSLPCG